jgi:hypothetical protein
MLKYVLIDGPKILKLQLFLMPKKYILYKTQCNRYKEVVLLRTNRLLSAILKSKKKLLGRMKGNERLYERFLIRHNFKMAEN